MNPRVIAPIEEVSMPDYHGRRGAPPPPPDIEAAMEEAGRTRDDYALAVAHARYVAWLADEHGIYEGPHGNTAPTEVFE